MQRIWSSIGVVYNNNILYQFEFVSSYFQILRKCQEETFPHIFVVGLYFAYIMFLQYNVYISKRYFISDGLSINITI